MCVVGAGIVGLAHALEGPAARRMLRVVVLERDGHPVGASVRNFGHVFVAAMADGDDLQIALTSRERWLELGRHTGLAVTEAGTILVVRHRDELALLQGAAANPLRDAVLLTAAEVRRSSRCPPGT